MLSLSTGQSRALSTFDSLFGEAATENRHHFVISRGSLLGVTELESVRSL